MGFSEEFFLDKFKDLCLLMGWGMTNQRKLAIYAEVLNYEHKDLVAALEKMKRERHFAVSRLLECLDEARGKRLEAEAARRKEREEREFMNWWKNHRGRKAECINEHRCYECKRRYCDLVAHDAIEGIKAMIDGWKTMPEFEREMARKYPGLGWESNHPDLQPF